MTSSIKITSLTDIGANLSTTSLVPVVNMSGVPETQKANLQIVGNLILTGAGTSFPPVAQAVLAQSVTNAAQPNITSIGTLSALNVSGNVTTGNLVAGNIVGTLTGSATTAGTVTTNAQPNITSVGTLNGLTVNGLTNLGPIGNVTITGGSAGQVLSTDGAGNLSWVSDATSTYGDGNVTSLLAAFGSNTITTTGLITGDGGGLSNVPYANLTGTPTLGNISTINTDGNASNILYGNGVFAASPSVALTGDGGNLSNITGANVVGNVGSALVAYSVDAANVSGLGNIATINIDGNVSNILYGNGVFAASPSVALTGDGGNLSNITGANVTGTVANANMSQYINVSDVSNNFSYHILLSAGSGDKSLHVDASDNLQYNPNSGILTAGRVDAQYFVGNLEFANGYYVGNVEGIGNIATINIDGNAGNILYGNGVFAAAPGAGNASLPLANGNSNFNITTVDGNPTITANNAATWTFDITGNLIVPSISGEQKRIKGTVETIYGDPWPATSTSTPSVVWTASSDIVVGAKLTVRVQQTDNQNTEMFDVLIAKEYPTGNVSYSVSNKLKTNDAIADTTVDVDLDGSNQITLSLTTENTCYISYSVTEFNNTFD